MAKVLSAAARDALASTDWGRVDAMNDAGIAAQIGANKDAAPGMAPAIDVRAIWRAAGMTQAQFAAAFAFSVRTVQAWERGAKRPGADAFARHRGRSEGAAEGVGGGLGLLIGGWSVVDSLAC